MTDKFLKNLIEERIKLNKDMLPNNDDFVRPNLNVYTSLSNPEMGIKLERLGVIAGESGVVPHIKAISDRQGDLLKSSLIEDGKNQFVDGIYIQPCICGGTAKDFDPYMNPKQRVLEPKEMNLSGLGDPVDYPVLKSPTKEALMYILSHLDTDRIYNNDELRPDTIKVKIVLPDSSSRDEFYEEFSDYLFLSTEDDNKLASSVSLTDKDRGIYDISWLPSNVGNFDLELTTEVAKGETDYDVVVLFGDRINYSLGDLETLDSPYLIDFTTGYGAMSMDKSVLSIVNNPKSAKIGGNYKVTELIYTFIMSNLIQLYLNNLNETRLEEKASTGK